jgi:long-chain acyl-CoA synthetase
MNLAEETLVSLQWNRARLAPNEPAIVSKQGAEWQSVGWQDYYDWSQACAYALVEAGLSPNDRVGLLSENRREWLIADIAIMTAGFVSVPLHSTLPPEQIQVQLRDSGARWLFCSNAAQLSKITQIRGSLPDLAGVTLFDPADGSGSPVLADWIARFLGQPSAELKWRQSQLGPDTLATIVYTSGSTGKPRGVMLTHGNILCTAHALDAVFPSEPGAAVLGWLPLSHIVARSVDHFMSLLNGATTWIAESPDKLVPNLMEVKPTHLSGVPRIYEKVLAALSAYGVAERNARLRAIFGPRLKWVTSGSAPLSPLVAEAFEQAGLPIVQGYGLTETSGVLTCNRPHDNKPGTVGQALPGLEIAIAPDGEILARGANITAGYWNDPLATEQTLRDGWLHTGDLGELDHSGVLTLKGRKKDLLLLSTGKKVVPTEVESLLAAEPCIEQAVLYGEGRSYLTALVVPSPEIRGQLAHGTNGSAEYADGVVLDMARRIGEVQRGLPPELQVKRFLMLRNAFSLEDGNLTVTMKPRRDLIFTQYAASLDRLYALPGAKENYPIGVVEDPRNG